MIGAALRSEKKETNQKQKCKKKELNGTYIYIIDRKEFNDDDSG